MCGIVGYLAMDKLPTDAIGNLKQLFVRSIERGRDATGIAYVEDGGIMIQKAPIEATKFVESGMFTALKVKKPKAVIGHLRMATQGDPEDNKNNHPFPSELGWAMVHNGVIHNDSRVATYLHIVKQAQTDSETMIRSLEHYFRETGGNIIDTVDKTANLFIGTITFALLTTEGEIYVYNGGRDIYLAFDSQKKVFYICSLKSVLNAVLVKEYDFGIFPAQEGVSVSLLPTNHLIHLSSAGAKLHKIKRVTPLEPERTRFVFE